MKYRKFKQININEGIVNEDRNKVLENKIIILNINCILNEL